MKNGVTYNSNSSLSSNSAIFTMSLAPPFSLHLHSSSSSSSSQPRPKFCSSFTLCCSHPKPFPSNSHFHPKLSFSNPNSPKPSNFIVKASETESESDGGVGDSEADQPYEEYEVELEQPYGLKFAKGRDGGTYIDAIAPGGFADKTGVFTVGDRVIATSAVFGTEIWPAAEYGRTMYTIRQRIGPLLMKMQKRYGKKDSFGEITEKEIIRAERNSGVVSNKVREIQLQNALRLKEQKVGRENDLREGLRLYKNAKYEEALEKFESVLGSKPTPDEASVASYNVACCYSQLNQLKAGLSALEDALEAGFEDFKRVRTDPDLANLRALEEFEPLLKRFDESFINENAINAIKSLFGFKK